MKINTVHIELTDKCQAACPMCLRNTYGAGERPHIKNTEITLNQFVKWFPVEFLKDLTYFYACGNNGDPLLAKDCLEIFEYVANSSTCGLSIHTNGSLRSKAWWTRAGEVLGSRGTIVFAIDGFKGEHELYRRNTNWDKIIENAKTFIAAGGRAKADCIVFKHNEDRIEELEQFLYSIGFEHVNLKPTERFYGKAEFPVYNDKFEQIHIIHPPTNSKWKRDVVKPNFVKLVDKQVLQGILDNVEIKNPECYRGENIYVNSVGNIFPCCIIGGCNELHEDIGIADNNEKIIRNVNIQSGIDLMKDLGVTNLDDMNMLEFVSSSAWLEKLPKHWNEEKKFVCARMCGKNFNKLVE
jgi:MoaA/NifB/PqqE/SkfB family radical SAM enzyme